MLEACVTGVHVLAGRIVLCLKTRKDRPEGSRLVRYCWCGQDPTTCPVHVLGFFFRQVCLPCAWWWSSVLLQCWGRSLKVGEAPFSGYSPSQASTALRDMMEMLGYENAQAYRTQDMRKGHTEDQLQAGASIEQILKDAEWRHVVTM